jgi:hypothetical protein
MQRFLLKFVAGGPSSVDPGRLTWVLAMIKAGLWLATGLTSALLVYWLHFKPVYEEDWTAAIGSLMCAGLAVCAAVGCLNNLGEAFSAIGKPHRHLPR